LTRNFTILYKIKIKTKGEKMARVTIEDCLQHVQSHFSLVHAAVRRARQLQRGSKPLMPKKDEKPTVIALREIAAGLVELVPLTDTEPELPRKKFMTDEEELAAILSSPDLNVEVENKK
jgi:DNA-directed RNA polymerase subunit omega